MAVMEPDLPALSPQARPASESGPLPTDYPACGVPQALMAQPKPLVMVPGKLWEVHAGLAMEALRGSARTARA